jgi:hypothetical protein
MPHDVKITLQKLPKLMLLPQLWLQGEKMLA